MTSVWDRVAGLLDPAPDPTWNDPNLWAEVNIKGWTGAAYQSDILSHLALDGRACARGPHGLGKSGMAAIAVLWFADTRDRAGVDWKVVTTASAWRQLKQYLWPEIHKWARRMTTRQFSRYELLQLELKLRFGSAFSVASDDPANIEGAHADEILYVIDEAKTVPVDTWDAIEGAMSTGNAYALAISTPGRAQGRFFDIQKRSPGLEDWWVRHVTLAEAIKEGRISARWAAQRAIQWGETNPVYLNRVLGEFSTTDSEGVIPLEWVEASQRRYLDLKESGDLEKDPITAVSCDVASSGPDMTLIGTRRGFALTKMNEYGRQNTMKTVGMISEILLIAPNGTPAVVDVIGVGTGVVDRLRELGFEVDAFNGSEGTRGFDASHELQFINRRAEAWWHMRDLLDPSSGSTIALPDNDLLTGDLCAPKWDQSSTGKIKVESKEEIRKRLGRSPDYGDMAVMAFAIRTGDPITAEFAPQIITKRSTWLR